MVDKYEARNLSVTVTVNDLRWLIGQTLTKNMNFLVICHFYTTLYWAFLNIYLLGYEDTILPYGCDKSGYSHRVGILYGWDT